MKRPMTESERLLHEARPTARVLRRTVPRVILCLPLAVLCSCQDKPDNTMEKAIPDMGMTDPKVLFLEQKGDWGYVIMLEKDPPQAIGFGTMCVAKGRKRTYWTHDEIVILRQTDTGITIEKKMGTRHYSVSPRSALSPDTRDAWKKKLMACVDAEGLDKRFPRKLFAD